MTKYAEGTTVSVGKSLDEIEHTIYRYGGYDIRIGKEVRRVVVGFVLGKLPIMIEQKLPDINEREFSHDGRGRRRTPQQISAAYDVEVRRRYRVLLLRLKSRFESVDAGETPFQAFMPYLLGAGGQTLERSISPHVDQFLERGALPPLLPGPSE